MTYAQCTYNVCQRSATYWCSAYTYTYTYTYTFVRSVTGPLLHQSSPNQHCFAIVFFYLLSANRKQATISYLCMSPYIGNQTRVIYSRTSLNRSTMGLTLRGSMYGGGRWRWSVREVLLYMGTKPGLIPLLSTTHRWASLTIVQPTIEAKHLLIHFIQQSFIASQYYEFNKLGLFS